MRIIASGTFDRLHNGHRHFLKEASKRGFVMVAITSDAMLSRKKHAGLIYRYRKRRSDVIDFMEDEGKIMGQDYIIKKIHDGYGFATKIRDVDAIMVTSHTFDNAVLINRERLKKGWRPLKIYVTRLIKDKKGVISSTRLRASCPRA